MDHDMPRANTAHSVVAALLTALLFAWGGTSAYAGEAQATQTGSLTAAHLFASRTQQVIVFGDSLSDVGTYRVGEIAAAGGGKFTTNPGPTWVESVGVVLGAPVTPFRQGLAGQSWVLGGTGYSMGGSRVSQQPGVGCHPRPDTGDCTAALTLPVTRQIDDYLGANGDRFIDRQLVFVSGGGNDILVQLALLDAKVRAGVPLDLATSEALGAVRQAATDLVGQVHRVRAKGATRVAVPNVPEIADTILGKSASPQVRALMVTMVQLFNSTLAAGLQGSGAHLIDIHGEVKRVVANPGWYGISEVNVPACDPAKIFALTQGKVTDGSSLFCSPRTLVHADAPKRFLFADAAHPTTRGHQILARFVLIELWRKKLL